MQRGGFRVIVGNPPYVSSYNQNTLLSYTLQPSDFETLECKNLYAYVVEKSRRELLAPAGYMGMILPITAFFTQGKLPFLERFYEWFPRTWLSFYHARPSALFDGE